MIGKDKAKMQDTPNSNGRAIMRNLLHVILLEDIRMNGLNEASDQRA
jgi:hypothetical protein